MTCAWNTLTNILFSSQYWLISLIHKEDQKLSALDNSFDTPVLIKEVYMLNRKLSSIAGSALFYRLSAVTVVHQIVRTLHRVFLDSAPIFRYLNSRMNFS